MMITGFIFPAIKSELTTIKVRSLNFERNGAFSSVELNMVVSKNKKYAKSHLTLLRKNFIKDMNELFFELFGSQQLHIISFKSRKDKRQILYKTSKEIFKKESFLKFMLKL